MLCSNCGGDHIRKLSLVYESGLTFVNTRTSMAGVGAGAGGLGIGVGSGRSRGTHTTATAARAAPPRKKRYTVAVIVFVISLLIATHTLGWLIVSAVSGAIIWNAISYNRNQYPKLYNDWDTMYLCERCGTIAPPVRGNPQVTTGQPRPLMDTIDMPALGQEPDA